MTRFSDLLKTNEVHSAYEDVVEASSTPVVEEPPRPEEEIADIIASSLNFNGMTKLQLEAYGRTVGIELDRRYKKDKLIKQLEDHLATS
tara:strand:+ start:295 stop:561 length:267 start_codon:yes stop_codon:yes gene_type:complete